MSGKLFIISAPSGTGKNTLVNEAIKRLSNYDISRVITYTARPVRNGEVNGSDYHFISTDDFKKKMEDGFFLESAYYADKLYGSPSSITQEIELGKSFILVIDRQGAKSVASNGHNAVTIWITPPNIETLKNRLKKRDTESQSQIEKRLEIAKEEMTHEQGSRLYQYHVVNDVFDNAVSELTTIIESHLKEA